MVLVTARLSHVTPAISDRSSRGKLKKKKNPSAECIVLLLVMSVEWLSCLGSKWLASVGIPLLVVQPSSWLGLTWVPYPSVPSLGSHWVPASCFWVLPHDFPGCFHVYFLFFDILKNFSMLTFPSFHYTAHVLTTSFSVSCLVWVSSSHWSFSVSPVCALSRILLNSRILTRTHHFPGPLFSVCVPWTN